jgi:sugar phosphate isomerase/epimerase
VKIGLGSLFLLPFKFREGLRFVQKLGVQSIEMACVGRPSREYCDPDNLLADRGELQRWLDVLKEHGLGISAFAVHGEPLSPNKQRAEAYSRRFRQVCKLAEAAGVDRLTTNAGLPEGAPGDTCPLWVADSFKPYNRSILSWQWEQRLIPFWREHAKIAQDHGCLVCLEPWVGEIVYSPKTLMRLREAIGPVIGCNLDPSHLFVQQIDVLESIMFLSDAIYNVHIKDTRIDPQNLKLQGLFDDTPHIHPEKRAWVFTLIGWGHDQTFWRDFITTLRFAGYEGSLSVEMECDYMDVKEGVEKSVAFLKPLLLETAPGRRWWEYAWEKEDMVNWWGMPPAMED